MCQHQTAFKPLPNGCDTGCTQVAGTEEGQCDNPTDKGCDGLLKANGEFFITCNTNDDCAVGNIGLEAGNCTLSKKRECFLDTIVATGDPDPHFPIGAATFCIAPTSNDGINSTAGLPGPGRLINQGIVQFNCSGGAYQPGVGCPP